MAGFSVGGLATGLDTKTMIAQLVQVERSSQIGHKRRKFQADQRGQATRAQDRQARRGKAVRFGDEPRQPGDSLGQRRPRRRDEASAVFEASRFPRPGLLFTRRSPILCSSRRALPQASALGNRQVARVCAHYGRRAQKPRLGPRRAAVPHVRDRSHQAATPLRDLVGSSSSSRTASSPARGSSHT